MAMVLLLLLAVLCQQAAGLPGQDPVLLNTQALTASSAGVVTFHDTFEAPVTKGVIDASTPFTTLADDETWGSVYKEGDTYYLYTGLAISLGVRTSSDGVHWGNRTVIFTAPGPGYWNTAMSYCPTVWKEGATYHMLFAGGASDGVVAVGHASSSSPTSGWVLDPSNPVYTNPAGGWSGGGAEPWGAIKVDGTYYLWVNNYGGIGERQTGLVTSTDLHTWTADSRNPIFTGQRFCPCVFEYGGAYYMLICYEPTGSTFAQIELYRCANPRFYPEDRQFLGTVLYTPRDPTTAYGRDLDCPTPILTDLSNSLTGDPIPFYYSIDGIATTKDEWTMGKFTISPSVFDDGLPLGDTYTNGNIPSAAFSLSTDAARSGSRSLKIDDTTTDELYTISINRAKGRISFWVDQTDIASCWIQGYGDNAVEALSMQLYWMKVQWKNGGTLEGGTPDRTKSAWYHFDITFDTTTGKWGFVVTDAAGTLFYEKTDLALSASVSEITRLRLWRDSELSGIYYFDDLTVGTPMAIPVASFTTNVSSGTAPLDVQFTDTSANEPTAWNWEFGDGTPNATGQHPAHTFATAGTYIVNLTASNSAGANTASETITVLPAVLAPVANFTANVTSGTAPLSVQFTDTSTNDPTAWSWEFGDGGTSTDQSPAHTFATAGTYTVNLTASNSGGANTTSATITVSAPVLAPVANFTANVTSGTAPLDVLFTDTSTGDAITGRAWDFNDDGAVDSTEQNPVHTFTDAGTYTVNLTVTNAGGTDSEVKTGYITVTAAPAVITIFGQTSPPTDVDGDGLYEDLDGNGELNFFDVRIFFQQMDWIAANEPVAAFDFNHGTYIDFNDIQVLFRRI